MKHQNADDSSSSPALSSQSALGFVSDGYERLVASVESESRRIVEARYSDDWNTSGVIRRWRMQRMMETEIAGLAETMMPDLSPEVLF